MYVSIAIIREAITLALPRLRGDTVKRDLWVALFAGWLSPQSGKATTITAPTTGKASNVARRAWKNNTPLAGTVSVPLAAWNGGKTPLIVKASSATPTVASQRIAITQAVDKIVAAVGDLAPTDLNLQAAVSVNPHSEGVIVTAYALVIGEDNGPGEARYGTSPQRSAV